jgi:hypothetical protein
MQLTSVFENGAPIDSKYTGEGKDVSPPLSWFDVPNGVMSFALICDDPDAPNPQRPAKEPWVHWVVFNIASDVTALPEGIPRFGREPNRFRRQTPAEAAGSDRRVLHLNRISRRWDDRPSTALLGPKGLWRIGPVRHLPKPSASCRRESRLVTHGVLSAFTLGLLGPPGTHRTGYDPEDTPRSWTHDTDWMAFTIARRTIQNSAVTAGFGRDSRPGASCRAASSYLYYGSGAELVHKNQSPMPASIV